MGSTAEQAPAASSPSPEVVGNAFVHQYYHILHQSAEHVHRFYQDSSKLGRPDENGVMGITTTMDKINEKILSLHYNEFRAEIKTVDAQESYQGGVLVLVTGYLTGKDNITRNFTQTFFLAPQEKNGYFVLNDTFRYVEAIKHQDGGHDLEIEIVAPVTPDQDPLVALENNVSEHISTLPEEASGEEVYNPPGNGEVSVLEEEAPVPEVVDEIQDVSRTLPVAITKVEETPKKSYASIVKVAPVPSSTQTPPLKRAAPAPKSTEVRTKATPPPAPAAETVPSAKVIENRNYQEEEAVGHSIYIKGLPMNAIPATLEAEFKQYGPIKRNGIQVRSNKDFCFGFVEFEEASSVQKALEASPVTIEGCQAIIEEKRSSSRVNNRARFPTGRGTGFRNEGGRGHGNYGGGRGYGRNDFNNRSEFANRGNRRGGFSNRAGDGYQRAENGGGRVNRSGGPTFNASAKSVVPGVPASA